METLPTLLCLVLVSFGVSFMLTSAVSQTDPTCPISIDSKVPELKRCLRMGDKFIKKYLMYLKNQARPGQKEFNACRRFNEFHSCMKPLLDKCSHIKVQFEHLWYDVFGNFSCICSGSPETACQKKHINLTCFEHEYWSELSQHCDLYFAYSEKYSDQQKCYYLQRRTLCREKRVSHMCGGATGLFTHTITKLFYTRHKHRYPSCDIGPPAGVVAESSCPKTFVEQMYECEDHNMAEEDMLLFYPTNTMVAKGNKDQIRVACRSFRKYRRCIQPLEHKCPEEKMSFFSFNRQLRTYDMKMQLICINYTLDYQTNLDCYKSVVRNSILDRCDTQWRSVEVLLASYDAHDFYCRQGNALSIELSKLRACYERTVSAYKVGGCSITGSAILAILTKNALNDPMYLKYNYAPFCIPPNVTFPTTSSTSTTLQTTTVTNEVTTSSMSSTDTTKTRSDYRTITEISDMSLSTTQPNVSHLFTGVPYHVLTTHQKEVKSNKAQNEINKPRTPRNSAQNHNGVSRTCGSVVLHTAVSILFNILVLRVT